MAGELVWPSLTLGLGAQGQDWPPSELQLPSRALSQLREARRLAWGERGSVLSQGPGDLGEHLALQLGPHQVALLWVEGGVTLGTMAPTGEAQEAGATESATASGLLRAVGARRRGSAMGVAECGDLAALGDGPATWGSGGSSGGVRQDPAVVPTNRLVLALRLVSWGLILSPHLHPRFCTRGLRTVLPAGLGLGAPPGAQRAPLSSGGRGGLSLLLAPGSSAALAALAMGASLPCLLRPLRCVSVCFLIGTLIAGEAQSRRNPLN